MYSEKNLYSKDHEWIAVDGDIGTVGITDFAQQELGDVVYVELPDVGKPLSANDPFGTVESVKAVSDVFSPVSGEVVEVNSRLIDEPELVNESPHDEAWIMRIRIKDASELQSLMRAEQYEEYIRKQ